MEDSDDYMYNFPGVFAHPFPQQLGFCEDISTLPNYDITNPHFIFADIQLGKDKARRKQLIEMNINVVAENVYYWRVWLDRLATIMINDFTFLVY